jgi:hypothetical protein
MFRAMGLFRRAMPLLAAGAAGAVAVRYLDQAIRRRALGAHPRPALPRPSAPMPVAVSPAPPAEPTAAPAPPAEPKAPPAPPAAVPSTAVPAPPSPPEPPRAAPPPPPPPAPAPPPPPPPPTPAEEAAATAARPRPATPAPVEEPEEEQQPTEESDAVEPPDVIDVVEDLISPPAGGAESVEDAIVVEGSAFEVPAPPDDRALAESVRTALAERPGLLGGDVDVDVIDGTVYLHGQLERAEAILDAEVRARRVTGVQAVESFLHLRGTPPPQAGELR